MNQHAECNKVTKLFSKGMGPIGGILGFNPATSHVDISLNKDLRLDVIVLGSLDQRASKFSL